MSLFLLVMFMEIKIIESQEYWDGWLNQNVEFGVFPQSWFWGEIFCLEGKKIERLAVVEGGEIIVQAQIVYCHLPFGWEYAFCPKGPVAKYQVSSIKYQGAFEILTKYLKCKNHIFFRLEPHNSKYLIHNTIKSLDINPRATVILDLSKSEEELLNAMHPKTRYNIRLAEKKNLFVDNKKDFDSFIKLSRQTSMRDGFKLHANAHYHHIISSSISYQLNILNNKNIIASGIFIAFGNTFTYLYGASDYENRQFMAPYLLQWEGIKMAKKLGYKYYDFFGIAPKIFPPEAETQFNYQYDAKHQYAGITRFKIGFGGETKEEPGTFDVVISSLKYLFYKVLRIINRLAR